MKIILAVLAFMSSLYMTGCDTATPATVQEIAPVASHIEEVETTSYVLTGRYYKDGLLFTDDGNYWEYQTKFVSGKETYDGIPVYAVMNDNGTNQYIYDDIIDGLVFDRMTAAYDRIEDGLSESFNIERKGNHINVLSMKGGN